MIPGVSSQNVDRQAAFKKVRGKVLTNTKTFPAQEPHSPLQLHARNIWTDALPDEANLQDLSSQLWNMFNADNPPQNYYEVDHPNYMLKQILVKCQPNPGTEGYSFDILDNSNFRVDNLVTTAFGNHFQPRIYIWDGSSLGKEVSSISGLYWLVDEGGYLYTGDKDDIDYSNTGYYLLIYRYTGATLDSSYPYVYEYEELTAPQTTFTLLYNPLEETVQMRVNGLSQRHGTDYTVSGVTITWSGDFSLEIGDFIEFVYHRAS